MLATSGEQRCAYTLDPDNVLLKLSKRRLLIGRRGMTVLYIRRILVADDEGRALTVRKHTQADGAPTVQRLLVHVAAESRAT